MSSAPKLTIYTEYISRASRALAAVTLVKRATASEIAVHSGAIQETWIEGYRADGWTVTGWMLVGIVACCILMSLVLLWRKTGRIVDMVDDETQTLDEGTPEPAIPMKVMITKNGRAAHCRKRLPIPFEIVFNSDSELVFSLRSKRRFQKSALGGGALGNENKF